MMNRQSGTAQPSRKWLCPQVGLKQPQAMCFFFFFFAIDWLSNSGAGSSFWKCSLGISHPQMVVNSCLTSGWLFWRWGEMISPFWPPFNQVARTREARCLHHSSPKNYGKMLLYVVPKACSSVRFGKYCILFLPCIGIWKALSPTVKKHVWFCWTQHLPNYLLLCVLIVSCVNHAPARSFFSPFNVCWDQICLK